VFCRDKIKLRICVSAIFSVVNLISLRVAITEKIPYVKANWSSANILKQSKQLIQKEENLF